MTEEKRLPHCGVAIVVKAGGAAATLEEAISASDRYFLDVGSSAALSKRQAERFPPSSIV